MCSITQSLLLLCDRFNPMSLSEIAIDFTYISRLTRYDGFTVCPGDVVAGGLLTQEVIPNSDRYMHAASLISASKLGLCSPINRAI